MSSNTIQNSASLISQLNAANSSLGKQTTVDPNSASALQDKFLLMLTTQLQNQDPMNPMDNSAITTQMAQLSTVSGIAQLNTTLSALSSSMMAGQTLSATSMIGHGVLVPGSTMTLSGSQGVGGVTLTQPADNLTVTITDASGNTVKTLNLGAQKGAGVVPFAWDGSTDAGGTAPDGNYTITATASLSGTTTSPSTLSYGTVNAVTPGTNGVTVNVGQMGSFALSSVAQVM
jgi:flagellar basal-body rod modification protein FlgD